MRKAILYGATVTALVAGSIIATARPAAAQAVCANRAQLLALLDKQFSEQPRAAGLAGDTVFELLVSPQGSWTVVATLGDGRTCIVAGGSDWTERPAQAARAGDSDGI